MLNVQKVRLRFIFARALYLCRLFSKKLMVKGFSERTGMSVKLSSSEFACKLVAHECTRMYIRGRGIYGVIQQKSVLDVQKVRLRLICARASYLSCLFAKKLTVKGFSEPTRTSVVPYRSEFACKLVAQECTGRTFLGGDVRGPIQYRVFRL